MGELRPLLIVDDDADDRELTLVALEQANLSNPIHCFQDGEEVLNFLYKKEKYATRTDEDPVAVIIDFKMPKVSGLEVVKQVKSDEKMKKIPIILFTSSKHEKDIQDAYQAGVNAYVVKPVDFEELTTVVKTLGTFWSHINEPPCD